MTLIDLKGHLCYLNFETFRGNIARINYVFTRESNILHVACNFNCLIENKGFFSRAQAGAYSVQEGQHPLTGQRAANFRLLANQSAERRLVTQ